MNDTTIDENGNDGVLGGRERDRIPETRENDSFHDEAPFYARSDASALSMEAEHRSAQPFQGKNIHVFSPTDTPLPFDGWMDGLDYSWLYERRLRNDLNE